MSYNSGLLMRANVSMRVHTCGPAQVCQFVLQVSVRDVELDQVRPHLAQPAPVTTQVLYLLP